MLALARDIAAVALGLSLALSAAVFLSGAAGLSGGLAASAATIAAAGLLSFLIYGLVATFATPPIGLLAVVTAVLALSGAFVGAHYFGVRGLWIAFLAAIGASLAWILILLFARRGEGVGGDALAAASPALVFVLLTFLCFGALSASSRAAADRAARQGGPGAAFAALTPFAQARSLFGAPPEWFDCAYATLGGKAAQPGLCSFNPPRVVTQPDWSEPDAAPENADARIETASLAPDGGAAPARQAEAPLAMDVPAPPDPTTPDFAAVLSNEGAAPPAPRGMSDAPVADAAASAPENGDASDENTLEAPILAEAPAEVAPASEYDSAPDAGAEQPAPAVAMVGATAAARLESDPDLPAIPGAERRRTTFVCFPMLDALAERLCPDPRLSEADFELRWREPGGDAVAPPDEVECFFDPGQALHATLVLNLSGELSGAMPRSARSDAASMRKVDAVYEMVTRLIGSVRAENGPAEGALQAPLMLSLYVANGSRLLSPWASQDFGADLSDRLFDVRSSGQTLALLRRLKTEIQALRRGAVAAALDDTLRTAIEERPSAPFEVGQSIYILVTDAAAAERFGEDSSEALAARLAEANAPMFVLSLGADAPSAALTRLAEDSGAAAYPARDAAAFADAIERAMRRSRSFCALKVRAPESFFERGDLEISLRRKLEDGCQLEQVATLSCEGLSMSERIEPAGR